ncbi:MAG: tetratricopeptide repeat protein [Planctomycetota bacterium]|nr:tetratricopeptide repeat protein [Planctomycetota bacterium]
MNRPAWLAPAAIVLLAVALRVIYVLLLRDHPLFASPNMDAGYHLAWAKALAGGEEFQDGPFFRAPLYPIVLAGLTSLAGEGTLFPRLAQSLLGGLSAYLTYRIGERVHGRVAGLIASVLVAVSWVLIAFDAELLIPTLFVPLSLFALDRALVWGFDDRPRPALIAGLAFGLAAIARPNILLFMPAAFALAAWRGRGWRGPVALTLGTCLAIGPVTVHNALEGDTALVATQAGVNLWIGNNPASDGSAAIVPGTPDGWWEGYYGAIAQAEAAEGRELRPTEVSAHFTGRALGWVRDEPEAWASHMLWKARLLMANVELANNSDIEFTAMRTMPLLRLSPSRWDLLLGLGLVGLLAGVRRGQRGAGVLVLYLGVYAASIVLFFVSARFRVPLVPILAIGAGYAVTLLMEAVRARDARALALLVAPSLLIAGLSNALPENIRRGDAAGLLGLGIAELRRGDAAAAQAHLEEAYSISPTNPQVRYQLAYALREVGGSPERIRGLCQVLPGFEGTPAALDLTILDLEVLLETEGPDPVLVRADALLEQYPGTSSLRFLRANALAASGRVDDALRALQEQARDEPQNPEPHYGAGQILEQIGRTADARASYGEVLARAAFCAPVVIADVRARLLRLGP